jgi:hypothetical protein
MGAGIRNTASLVEKLAHYASFPPTPGKIAYDPPAVDFSNNLDSLSSPDGGFWS